MIMCGAFTSLPHNVHSWGVLFLEIAKKAGIKLYFSYSFSATNHRKSIKITWWTIVVAYTPFKTILWDDYTIFYENLGRKY